MLQLLQRRQSVLLQSLELCSPLARSPHNNLQCPQARQLQHFGAKVAPGLIVLGCIDDDGNVLGLRMTVVVLTVAAGKVPASLDVSDRCAVL